MDGPRPETDHLRLPMPDKVLSKSTTHAHDEMAILFSLALITGRLQEDAPDTTESGSAASQRPDLLLSTSTTYFVTK